MLIVTKQNCREVVERLKARDKLALDTETTGLRPYKGDRLFSIIIASHEEVCYFNFIPYEGLDPDFVLGKAQREILQELFNVTSVNWFMHNAKFDMHNAKFDMHMLAVSGFSLAGPVCCTYVTAKLENNSYFAGYSLDQCVKRMDPTLEKLDIAKEWMDKNGAYSTNHLGKKDYQFFRVPFDIITKYACMDAKLTLQLAEYQHERLAHLDSHKSKSVASVRQVFANENRLLKTVFEMENRGVLIDVDFCRAAMDAENKREIEATAKFKELTGVDFVDSAKALEKAFAILGLTLPKNAKTATGQENANASYAVLEKIDHPVAKAVLLYRDAHKRKQTYFANFLFFADENNAIHGNFNQAGTVTGRFSASDPNLQNLNKENEDDEPSQEIETYPVRRAFVPRPDHCFFMVDYKQMEYRLFLDYANEKAVIQQVLEGVDVHQATANIAGTKRGEAKTLNFAWIYGAGNAKLAAQLKKTETEAKNLRYHMQNVLPNMGALIKKIMAAAEERGFVTNWFGRRCLFPDKKFAYKAPNHLIQGGCADIVKLGMNECHDFLKPYKSKLLLNIHDENIFEMHKDELHLCQQLCDIMRNAYKHIRLPMDVDASFSWKSLHDKEKGFPA